MSPRGSRPVGRPRRAGGGSPKRFLHIFVEGSATEDVYIQHLHRQNRAEVSVLIDERRGVPATLVDLAVKEKISASRQQRRGKGSAPAEIWCVFDCDEHPALKESIQRALDNGISVAFSNPCIELWFVLHGKEVTSHVHRHQIQRESCDLWGFSKRPGVDLLEPMHANFQAARDRARRLSKNHRLNGSWERENPSSNVWELVESLSANS